jgi:hypothetical protein
LEFESEASLAVDRHLAAKHGEVTMSELSPLPYELQTIPQFSDFFFQEAAITISLSKLP